MGAGKRTGKDPDKVIVPPIFPDNDTVHSVFFLVDDLAWSNVVEAKERAKAKVEAKVEAKECAKAALKMASRIWIYCGSRWPSVGAERARSSRAETELGPGPIRMRSAGSSCW